MYTVCINAHADIKLQGCGDLICVPADMDSYITKPGLPPRDRFLQSIQQHCQVSHLRYIVHENGLDVRVGGSELLLKAAGVCNAPVLLWLIFGCGINANECRGAKGRTVLHYAVAGQSTLFWCTS